MGPRGLSDLVRAQAALLRARRRLDREPIGSLADRSASVEEALRGDPIRADALALAVARAARFGIFRPYCLVRAMALRELLEAEGIHGASIRVGVRKRGDEFQAHAWVVWGRRLLGDLPAHVRTFTEVDDLRLLPPR